MMFPFFFDWTYVLVIPPMILAIWAQMKVRRTFSRYSEIASRTGLTGKQAARQILDANGLMNVQVEAVEGSLTDHYDPRTKVVRLSEPIFQSSSLAALAVAAHESGHAVQDQVGYAAMRLRASVLPAANLGSTLAFPIFFIGLIFPHSVGWLMDAGIVLFTAAVAFHVVTLPVEFDASRRAIRVLASGGYLAPDEVDGARKVLSAAAWTYVAAAAVTVTQLLRMLILRQARD
jgi:Zn-dependent membrane protease YugP